MALRTDGKRRSRGFAGKEELRSKHSLRRTPAEDRRTPLGEELTSPRASAPTRLSQRGQDAFLANPTLRSSRKASESETGGRSIAPRSCQRRLPFATFHFLRPIRLGECGSFPSPESAPPGAAKCRRVLSEFLRLRCAAPRGANSVGQSPLAKRPANSEPLGETGKPSDPPFDVVERTRPGAQSQRLRGGGQHGLAPDTKAPNCMRHFLLTRVELRTDERPTEELRLARSQGTHRRKRRLKSNPH